MLYYFIILYHSFHSCFFRLQKYKFLAISENIANYLHKIHSIPLMCFPAPSEAFLTPTSPRYAMSGFYIEMGGFMGIAARNVGHRTSQRRHDMTAGVTLKQSLTEPIRNIRRVWARFGSFRLETEDPKNNL